MPDLRYMNNDTHAAFRQIVLGGALQSVGMKSFAGELSESDVDDLHNYLKEVANLTWQAQTPPSLWARIKQRWNDWKAERDAQVWLKENTPPL